TGSAARPAGTAGDPVLRALERTDLGALPPTAREVVRREVTALLDRLT
ncbi:FAD dependent dehydrogenase, partial [Streptomyces sp. SID9913]|nr:FAD dependent dehydrogenase [Streptomyces sp. SID9913]